MTPSVDKKNAELPETASEDTFRICECIRIYSFIKYLAGTMDETCDGRDGEEWKLVPDILGGYRAARGLEESRCPTCK